MGQFQTYPEDAQNEQFVWVAFARYDAWYDDGEDSYSDSGRCVYVTTSKEDADKQYDAWLDHECTDTECFSVRRGFVESYPSFEDDEFNKVLYASDDVSWSKDLDKVFG